MAEFDVKKKQDFDLEVVHKYFEKCLTKEGLVLEDYLNAYHELCRFFHLMGRIFGFVAKDIESKIHSIEYHLKKDSFNYNTVEKMVEYESSNGISAVRGSYPAGCRTLLRLHQALEFILAFMKRISEEEDDNAKTSQIAWEVYSETLCNHHPWMTRKLAAVAVYALPSKGEIIDVMCKQSYDDVLRLLNQVTFVGDKVYNSVNKVLKVNDLLHIP